MSNNDLFAAAVVRRAPVLSVRLETEEDTSFILDMAVQCSPLNMMMPLELCRQQAEMQLMAHRSAHPEAIGYLACIDENPCGRFLIDWMGNSASTYGVDLAVLPAERGSGAGLAMLRAWLEVADDLGKTARLEVLATNPARRIYDRLGFVLDASTSEDDPVLFMERPTKPGRRA